MTNTLSSYRWTPALLDDFRKEMSRFAGGLFDDASNGNVFAPSVNFAETETGYEVSVELPGMKPEDVHVEFKDGHLWISGERKNEVEEKGKTYHRVERRYGSFRRVIAIGNEVDAEKVDATYKDGVLTVDIPKVAAAQPKRIQVKT
ncbi:MAG TPA: Hsp20/alpha crystallin family protein [Pirellulaceae bacterium]|nr:Hsp20/alpha crystallin family protein [Planctomycetales bacterium]MCB9936814.1 Hsp20/alpha crystallin family protein [Planctomycetaceae bacterium]HRX79182.1 Hsp20/alpha crystallin family protein [Pirellulaceae bacterium]